MPRIRTKLEELALLIGESLNDDVAAWGIEHERDGQVVLMITYRDGTTVEWTGRVTDGGRDVA